MEENKISFEQDIYESGYAKGYKDAVKFEYKEQLNFRKAAYNTGYAMGKAEDNSDYEPPEFWLGEEVHVIGEPPKIKLSKRRRRLKTE